MAHRTPIVGGNWKMNTALATAKALAGEIAGNLGADLILSRVDVALFPPFPYLLPVGGILRDASSRILLGAQDVYPEKNGAFTGEVSLDMLADCGVRIVLVGHSERRHVIRESDDLVAAKARAVLSQPGMQCVLCVGETKEQRQAGQTDEVNERQLRSALAGVPAEQISRLVIAYEPVWAIGTGIVATPQDAALAHAHIRRVLGTLYGPGVAEQTRIQYGGSANASNVRALLSEPGVDGGLVGGASLKAADFCTVVRVAGSEPS
jgi:triosephosphate isomerase